MDMTDTPKNIHQGRNVKRFREMLGLKQEALAVALGGDWSQKRVSLLEQREIIDEPVLSEVAEILRVPVEAIKSFTEEAVFNIIGNTYHDASSSVQYQCTFNPIDKLVELFEENKRLYQELLRNEREKVKFLEGSDK